MIIVPDSNALFHDRLIEGWQIRAILSAEAITGLRFVILEVVWDELRNQIPERSQEFNNEISRILKKFPDLKGVFGECDESMIKPYQQQMALKKFDEKREQLDSEQRTLKYPHVSTEELSQRSIQRRRPFQDGDRGLRDTLVWLTILEYLLTQPKDAEPKVIFVTNNKKDFLNENGDGLHEDLLGDLKLACIPNESVIVRTSLRTVITDFISNKLTSVEWVRVAIESGQIGDLSDNSDSLYLDVCDWFLANYSVFEENPKFWQRNYLYYEFDTLDNLTLEYIETSLSIGGDLVAVDSVWTAAAVIHGTVDHFEDLIYQERLYAALKIEVTSILHAKEGSIRLNSHEINDVEIVGISLDDDEPDFLSLSSMRTGGT